MNDVFQTLSGFISNPFNVEITNDKPKEFENMYQTYKRNNKISIISIYDYQDIIMIHVKIPSETYSKNFYDVVIQFTPADSKMTKAMNIEEYYVKFFSNSPSFVYKYSALYYAHDMLIDSLLGYYNEDAIKKMPEKTNSKMELFYDKSIYIACRYLLDHKKQYLSKIGISFKRTTNFNRFLKNIQDTETISINANAAQIEKNVKKTIVGDKKEAEENKKKTDKITRGRTIGKTAKIPKKTPKKKITPKKSTFK